MPAPGLRVLNLVNSVIIPDNCASCELPMELLLFSYISMSNGLFFRYPYVKKKYANRVKLCLEYLEKFEVRLEKRAKRRLKRTLNTQTLLNTEAEVLLSQKKKVNQSRKSNL